MNMTAEQIAQQALSLPLKARASLAGRLAQSIDSSHAQLDSLLSKMAADPQIQREVAAIERDFQHVETDGISKV
jgi:hypothetical protein